MYPSSSDPRLVDQGALADAVELVLHWRSSFQRPLNVVTQGLRQFVRREQGVGPDVTVPVAQRLKRLVTIVDKLARMPTTKLTQLQDIGGCRAVLDDQDEVYAVLERITRNWDIRGRIRDYVQEPKSSGYRAVHVAVMRQDRLIEIQLRTRAQHEWAVAVERTSARLFEGIKFGVGPPDLMRFFRMAAEGMALTEAGQSVDEGFWNEFVKLREQVRQYLPPPATPPE
jgi:hypothetical protein